jgi:hypothetical protein
MHKVCAALIAKLPSSKIFQQNFHYSFTDWLPFYWEGFEQSTRYSYILESLEDLDLVFKNFDSDYRNNKVKKAKQMVRIEPGEDIKGFFEVAMMSFQRQNLPLPFDFDFFEKYDAAITKHKARKMFFAVDDQNKIHSVAYLLFDHDRVYFHIAGDNPELRGSGASILLVWEAIKFTKNELGLNIFDFEGSMFKPIERVRRQFGATQVPYFEIKKYNSLIFKLLDQIRKR